MNLTKILIVSIYILKAILFQAFAQLNLKQLININYGDLYNKNNLEIKNLFVQKPIIWKGDFYGTYKIEYENTPFNFYGNGHYIFQYAKEMLISAKVEYEFNIEDTLKFIRLLNTINEDLIEEKTKLTIKQIGSLNPKIILSFINKNYSKEMKPNFLGGKIWSLKNLTKNSYLSLSVNLINRYILNHCQNIIIISIEVCDENLVFIKNKIDNMYMKYSILNE